MKRRDDEGNRIYECPVCFSGEVKVFDHLFYGRCDNCNATLIDYKPFQHQEAFHQSSAQYRLNIGGFGSGKTTASCAELSVHALGTPNGRSLITAPTLSLVKDAVIPELDKFLPEWFIEYKRMSPSPYYKLKNGHEIIVYSAADQQKLRSLNLTAFYIEEASGVNYDIFDQLMTRLRHKAGVIKDDDGNEVGYKFMGILSTNPEEGWVKDKFLLVSEVLKASESIDVDLYEPIMKRKRNRHFHSFISSTRDNKELPGEFIERMSAGKSPRWIRKYVDCIMDVREGVVYPDFYKNTVEPFKIPKEWKRIAGFDPGYADGVAFPIAAVHPRTGVIYVYGDYYEQERPVSYHAMQITKQVKGFKFLHPIQADPSVQKRNERDGVSYKDYFYKISKVVLDPGNNDIMYGIEKVRDYIYAGKLKFFNNLENLKEEANKYVYPTKVNSNVNDIPVDKYNHLWDAIRYMIVKLPRDPNDMNEIYIQNELNVSSTFMEGFYNESGDDDYFGEDDSIFVGVRL